MKSLKISIVIRKNNKWFVGYLSNGKFTENTEIKKLSDVKKIESDISLTTLKKFLKDM